MKYAACKVCNRSGSNHKLDKILGVCHDCYDFGDNDTQVYIRDMFNTHDWRMLAEKAVDRSYDLNR